MNKTRIGLVWIAIAILASAFILADPLAFEEEAE